MFYTVLSFCNIEGQGDGYNIKPCLLSEQDMGYDPLYTLPLHYYSKLGLWYTILLLGNAGWENNRPRFLLRCTIQ